VSTSILDKLNAQEHSGDFSKPSSTTTACTRATSVYAYTPSNKSVKSEKKRDKKAKDIFGDSMQVGKKRAAQQKLGKRYSSIIDPL
jgi:hypothetical protein